MQHEAYIHVPFPPSVNHYKKTSKGRYYKPQAVVDFEHDVAVASWHLRGEFPGPVSVKMVVVMPDHRKRDIDNLPKVLFDALTAIGVWPDDSCICELHIRRKREPEPPGIVHLWIRDYSWPVEEVV